MPADWIDEHDEPMDDLETADEVVDEVVEEPVDEPVEQTDEVTDDAAEKPEKQTVPLAAHLEERNKLTARIDQLERRLQSTEVSGETQRELLDNLRRLRAERKAETEKIEAEPEIDYLEDPKGYVDSKLDKTLAELREAKEQGTKLEQAQKQQAVMQQVVTNAASQEQAFVKETPDYYNALGRIREVMSSQLKLQYPDATDAQIQQTVAQRELAEAANILSRGGNVAQYAYQYAKTLGYTPPEPEKDGKTKDDELAAMRARRDKAEGMGGSGSGIDDLLDADDDEFEAAWKETFGSAS